MDHILGFDVGATKTAWGSFSPDGKQVRSGRFQTPDNADEFIAAITDIIIEQQAKAVGIGIAGTVTPNHAGTQICGNIPHLSDLAISERINERHTVSVRVDNDARCALIGEIWKGKAEDLSSCVFVTLGSGVGGAIMQKGKILPHPQDLSQEVSRIVVDPTDIFPAKSGPGTVEAFIGGRNLEERLQIDLHEQADLAREGDEEAKEVWHAIAYFFIQCMEAIYNQYSCKTIMVGGIGAKDLKLYFQDPAPCEIIAASLGGEAGVYGAARLGMDLYEESHDTNKDWD